MIYYEEIKKIFYENGGIANTASITNKGIHNTYLKRLVNDGKIEQIKKGLYLWIEGFDLSEIAIITKLFPESIICMNSALYYHGYTDRTPDKWHIAVSKDIGKESLKIRFPPIKPYFIEPKYLLIGVTNGEINGIQVKVFDKERAICDVIRYSNKLDKEIVNKAIQAYVRDSQKRISTLIEYSKKFKIYKKLKVWMEVWL